MGGVLEGLVELVREVDLSVLGFGEDLANILVGLVVRLAWCLGGSGNNHDFISNSRSDTLSSLNLIDCYLITTSLLPKNLCSDPSKILKFYSFQFITMSSSTERFSCIVTCHRKFGQILIEICLIRSLHLRRRRFFFSLNTREE